MNEEKNISSECIPKDEGVEGISKTSSYVINTNKRRSLDHPLHISPTRTESSMCFNLLCRTKDVIDKF